MSPSRIGPGICALVALCSAATAHAGQAQVGNGVNLNPTAPIASYAGATGVKAGAFTFLYSKAELAEMPPSVLITAIEYDKHGSWTASGCDLEIYLENTTATSVPNNTQLDTFLASGTLVYSSSAQAIPAAAGWLPFTFTAPFTYANNNLRVTTVYDCTSNGFAKRTDWGVVAVFSGTGSGVMQATAVQGTTLLNYTPTQYRPNTRFDFATPSTPFVVVRSSGAILANGTTYANAYAFASGVAYPNRLTVTNEGGATANLGTPTFTGVSNVSMAVITALPATLAPGASADFVYTHTGTAASGVAGYTVNLPSDAPQSPFTFSVSTPLIAPTARIHAALAGPGGQSTQANPQVYLGELPVGTPITVYSLVTSNFGTAALNLTGTPAIQTSASNATVSFTQPGASVGPGIDVAIPLTLTVGAVGQAQVDFTIPSNDSLSPLTFSLYAVGVASGPAPDLKVQAFGPVTPGGTVQLAYGVSATSVQLSNAGTGVLAVSAEAITNATCTASVSSPFSGNIAPGGLAPFSLSLTHPGTGCTFDVSISSNDPDTPVFLFHVNAAAPGPVLVVSDAPSGHATLLYEPNIVHHMVLSNIGEAPLHVSALTITAVNYVTVQFHQPFTPLVIGPLREAQVELDIAPEDPSGFFHVVVASDDPAKPSYVVAYSMSPPTSSGGCAVAAGGHGFTGLGGLLALTAIGLILVRRTRRRTRG